MMILFKMVNLIRVNTTSVLLLYLSEFRLIQPLSGIWFYPTHNKVKESRSLVFLKVHSKSFVNESLKPTILAGGYSHHNFLVDCLMSFYVYSLFGQSHIELITLNTFLISNCQ